MQEWSFSEVAAYGIRISKTSLLHSTLTTMASRDLLPREIYAASEIVESLYSLVLNECLEEMQDYDLEEKELIIENMIAPHLVLARFFRKRLAEFECSAGISE